MSTLHIDCTKRKFHFTNTKTSTSLEARLHPTIKGLIITGNTVYCYVDGVSTVIKGQLISGRFEPTPDDATYWENMDEIIKNSEHNTNYIDACKNFLTDYKTI